MVSAIRGRRPIAVQLRNILKQEIMKIARDIEFSRFILSAVAQRRPESFAGVGLIFYRDLAALPHLQLRGSPECPALPVRGLLAIAETVAAVSAQSSPWHDGFHFIDIEEEMLTHLSQFLSPPIPSYPRAFDAKLPTGARQATALLASSTSGIACTGLVSVAGDVAIYENGNLQNPWINKQS